MGEEIINAIIPFILTANLIGLFSYKITNTGDIVINPYATIYSVCIFIFSIYNLFYVSIWCVFFSSDSSSINKIEEKIYVFYKISEGMIFFCAFICIQLDVKKNTIQTQLIMESNNIFNKIGIYFCYKKLKYIFIKRYILFYIFLIIIFIIDYFIMLNGGYYNITILSWLLENTVIASNLILVFSYLI